MAILRKKLVFPYPTIEESSDKCHQETMLFYRAHDEDAHTSFASDMKNTE